MIGSIKLSVRDSIIYGFGNVAVKIVGFILIPLYTNPDYFTTEDFGILGLLEISGLVLTAILASSLPQSLTRWYWDKDYISEQKSVFFMSFTTQIVVSALLIILLIPLSKSFSILLFSNINWTRTITYVIIASGLQAVNNIINTLMRLQSRALLYISANILKLVLVLILTVYLIVFRKMGLEGIYLAQVIGNFTFIIALAFYTKQNIEIKFNLKIFRDMHIYGYPLLIANISAVALNVIDRYSLNSLTVLKYVAIYTMAFKITSVLKLVIVDSIKLAVSPMMIKKISSPDNKRFYSKILLYTSFVLMIGIICISLFSLEITQILDKSKTLTDSVRLVPILALSVFFINMKEINVYGLHIVKKTSIISLIVIATSVVSLFLNIVLISLWDATGCAIATLISQVFYWGIVFYYSQKNFYIPYENKKLIILFVFGTILSFSPLLIDHLPISGRLLIKSALLAGFPFILYMFRFYDETEKMAIAGFVKKWSNPGNLRKNLKSLREIKEDFDQTAVQ